MFLKFYLPIAISLAFAANSALLAQPVALRTGIAGHAFDHNGEISDQADAALASGCNIIYCGRIGELGYGGLPEESKLAKARDGMLAYTKKSKKDGIRLAIGYVCATSIVKLDAFDHNWTAKFRAQFHTPPADWRQQDKDGKPLPSWYGGDYQPACMNNPDWRTYEKNILRMELESGCDGIFFDNPTVHPNGCYCPFCMGGFAKFLAKKANGQTVPASAPIAELRQQAIKHPVEFLEFRGTIARDFIAEMRTYARHVKRDALVTCNNSLNAPEVLFSQTRTHGYNINEMSRTEDFVLVEDMNTQPRTAGGRTFEYAPTYKQLHAINHGKPVVAVTVADADYHTAPNLMRLAMAEAAANDASYLAWPTWPEAERNRITTTVKPEADFLRQHEKLLNDTEPRCDVTLFLCYRRWLQTDHCTVSDIANALSRENIQYTVYSEEDFGELTKMHNGRLPVLLVESRSVLNDAEKQAVAKFERAGGKVVAADHGDWLGELKHAVDKPSVVVQGPATVRVVVRDQGNRTIAHIYNLNIQKLTSFTDQVHPAENVQVKVRKASGKIHLIQVQSADADAKTFTAKDEEDGTLAVIDIPRLDISAIAVIQ
jgi:hypothetical protein